MKLIITLSLTLLMIPSIGFANETPKYAPIIVTLPPLSGLVSMLLPQVQNTCLLSAGADPHHFQPSPKQVDTLQQKHIFIRASRDDQGWPIQVKQNQTIDLWASENHGWLQFAQVRRVLPHLAKSLSRQLPQYQRSIQMHLPIALQRVNDLEKSWDHTLEKIEQRGVFMQHPAWQALLKSKNVPVWAVLESSQHGHEHGPRHLEKALKTLEKHPSALLFGSQRHSNRSLAWLNKHQNSPTPLVLLDELGVCNQPWDKLMQNNLNILREQL